MASFCYSNRSEILKGDGHVSPRRVTKFRTLSISCNVGSTRSLFYNVGSTRSLFHSVGLGADGITATSALRKDGVIASEGSIVHSSCQKRYTDKSDVPKGSNQILL